MSSKPQSKLQNTYSSADRDIDDLLSQPNQSDDSFLPPVPPSPKRVKEPIPANRIALLRIIEDESREQRRRQRIRDLGYTALKVIAIVVALLLLSITMWLFFVAFTNTNDNGLGVDFPDHESILVNHAGTVLSGKKMHKHHTLSSLTMTKNNVQPSMPVPDDLNAIRTSITKQIKYQNTNVKLNDISAKPVAKSVITTRAEEASWSK